MGNRFPPPESSGVNATAGVPSSNRSIFQAYCSRPLKVQRVLFNLFCIRHTPGLTNGVIFVLYLMASAYVMRGRGGKQGIRDEGKDDRGANVVGRNLG